MHLCFVDESGDAAKPGRDKPVYFVIAGLIIPEERWHAIAARADGIKRALKYRGELKWRYFAPHNDDAENPMLGWSFEKRNELRAMMFSVVTEDRSIKIVAAVAKSSLAYKIAFVKTQQEIYFRTYKIVTERFQYLLQDISRTSGRKTNGIIVADHRGTGDDEAMRVQHQKLVEQNQAFASTYNNLVEGVFLTPSHLSVGVQLADLVAGAIFRKFESNDDLWYQKILPSFRVGPNNKIDGFGIARFPNKGWDGFVP